MILSLAEYIRLLKDYERMEKKNQIIQAPILDTSILVVDQGISTADWFVCSLNKNSFHLQIVSIDSSLQRV